MLKNNIIILLVVFAVGCANKKEKATVINQVEDVVLKQEIDSLETFTEEIKNTKKSIEASIERLDNLLKEINN